MALYSEILYFITTQVRPSEHEVQVPSQEFRFPIPENIPFQDERKVSAFDAVRQSKSHVGPYQAHPHDIATATLFSVPICTAGETAGFSAVIHGLAHGVWYGLALVVLNGSDYMHGTESLLEVLDESADVDARESYSRRLSLALPGLLAGEYTIRLSVFDLFQIWIQDFDQGLKHRSMGTLAAGSWKEEWLVSTTVQNLHVRKNEVLILKSQLHSGLI